MKKKFVLFCFIVTFSVNIFAQTDSAGLKVPEDRTRTGEEGLAAQEFRRGVQAYYRGSFNEAILQFEKSLSYLPTDNMILDWLGKSYYKAGMEGSALNYWEIASNAGYGGLLLKNKIEIVRERRVTGQNLAGEVRLSESGNFDGNYNGNLVFSGPMSVLPNPNGTFWTIAYNTNELLLINQNGQVIDRITGPINGFDRPIDIIRLRDGKLLISESAGDRLAVLNRNGRFEKYIGAKGRKVGQMVGPQYLAQDELGNIYVTDYGNRRVDVFDKDGNGLFFFGGKQSNFSGLKGPTGIIVFNDSVFVADDVKGCIYEFDRSGNFIRNLVEEKTFAKPEAIRSWNGRLLICDSNKVIGVTADDGALFEYGKSGNAPSRLNCAVPDVNSNIIVTDFKANEIYMMSEIQELVGGMFVQIENINADKFPNVIAEVKVENRHRQPVVGLGESNFYMTEGKRPVNQFKFIGASSNNTFADITFIIDRSIESSYFAEQIDSAVREIAQSMNGQGILRIVSAGKIPVTEYIGKPEGAYEFSSSALKTSVTPVVQMDLAIRLAANDLINAEKKRSIILLTAGNVTSGAFDRYNLAELTSYLNNNSINFSVVQMSQKSLCSELDYVVTNTNGVEYYVFRNEGLSGIMQDLLDIPQGVYQFSFVSSMQTNFGEKFLPIEVEVYLLNKSGRDEGGYFAPLQ